MKTPKPPVAGLALIAVAVIAGQIFLIPPAGSNLMGQTSNPAPDKTIKELTDEIVRLQGLLPDQSHAMADVGYHMSHAWFAAKAKNWPLAKFNVDETMSHIGWAVRIKPIRKGPDNSDFPLQPYADAISGGPIPEMQTAIRNADLPAFEKSYQAALTACYACHVASAKPYLKLKPPAMPDSGIIDYQPDSP
ncbi:MAG: hypothetical protein JWM59_3210 [Verrucomicrobiales bacterium]|nr:hypothetical protein [Verrucomicrobiales bacterium]